MLDYFLCGRVSLVLLSDVATTGPTTRRLRPDNKTKATPPYGLYSKTVDDRAGGGLITSTGMVLVVLVLAFVVLGSVGCFFCCLSSLLKNNNERASFFFFFFFFTTHFTSPHHHFISLIISSLSRHVTHSRPPRFRFRFFFSTRLIGNLISAVFCSATFPMELTVQRSMRKRTNQNQIALLFYQTSTNY